MKSIELSDEAFAALQRLATAQGVSPSQLVSSLLGANGSLRATDNLAVLLSSADFTAQSDLTARYLGLLAWCAQNYSADFADFISHQESRLRYLMLSRDEINEARAHNQARPIAGTAYWVVMTIDDDAKSRFVRRLLEYVGCQDEIVARAIRALGLPETGSFVFRLLSA